MTIGCVGLHVKEIRLCGVVEALARRELSGDLRRFSVFAMLCQCVPGPRGLRAQIHQRLRAAPWLHTWRRRLDDLLGGLPLLVEFPVVAGVFVGGVEDGPFEKAVVHGQNLAFDQGSVTSGARAGECLDALRSRPLEIGLVRVGLGDLRSGDVSASPRIRGIRTRLRRTSWSAFGVESAGSPSRVWAADLTYVPRWEGVLYLAVVLDLGSSSRCGLEHAAHSGTGGSRWIR